jgi:hypothetical protein
LEGKHLTSTSGLARRATLCGFAALLAGSLAAACGGSSSSSQGNGTQASPTAQAASAAPNLTSERLCAKLSPASLQQITGTAWSAAAPPPGLAQPDTAACNVSGKRTLAVVVHNTNGRAAVQNSLKAHLLPYQPVTGVADQAAYASMPAGTAATDVLVVSKGDASYIFTMVSPDTSAGQGLETLKKVLALVTT